MENISFISMYEDMLSRIGDFNQKNYNDLIQEFMKKYGPYIISLTDYAKTIESEEDKQQYYESLALPLSTYVKEVIETYPPKKREKLSVDHNVTMVAYFLPVVSYYKLPECMALAETIVKVWNENKTTGNTLQVSSYDAIAGGFKKSIFCYITTAVCDTLDKPDDCYELTMLRAYRDRYLSKMVGGRELIKEYYDIAPRIVLSIDTLDNHEEIYKELYQDYILPCIKDIENEQFSACKDRYVEMVRKLENDFITH